MNKIYFLSFLLVSLLSNAQQKLSFDYDQAGNQTQRKWCTSCHDKNSTEIPKEITDIKPEDLKEFFPGDQISYYPNPVKERLYLKWKLINGNKVSSIQLYSLNGQLIMSYTNLENKDDHVMDFQKYPRGIYTLVLHYTNGDEKSIKIIKEE